jgi:hypothetical protein
MGVAFGEINFLDITTPYDFFKSYRKTNKIEFTGYLTTKSFQRDNTEFENNG